MGEKRKVERIKVVGIAILLRKVRVGLTEKVIFEQRLDRG